MAFARFRNIDYRNAHYDNSPNLSSEKGAVWKMKNIGIDDREDIRQNRRW